MGIGEVFLICVASNVADPVSYCSEIVEGRACWGYDMPFYMGCFGKLGAFWSSLD
jgi:hypothetical protein